MFAFTGIKPRISESGIELYGERMVKHGSSYLRYTLINCRLSLICCDMTFASYYIKKRAEGIPHKESISFLLALRLQFFKLLSSVFTQKFLEFFCHTIRFDIYRNFFFQFVTTCVYINKIQ